MLFRLNVAIGGYRALGIGHWELLLNVAIGGYRALGIGHWELLSYPPAS
ncbi:hypothetical protein [Trichormus azollae]|jgi:hypothetical protein|uniref:Uncharacterized protein n=1 Tax=Nostoc azollae (strain 0708) TaxID=551115 RepID=D7DX24_NOSA0|nr:hypothetical protein [Trichormus azollae]ADI64197.1 hypothetical protein Aazo_2192 ['Nostoc azollae' 0708]